MNDSAWSTVRKLLVVRLDNLGDVLLATPAIRALREGLPEAEIVLHASAVGAEVADLDPDLSRAIVYEAPWMDPERRRPVDPAAEQAIIERLAAERFDAAVIFTSYHQSSLPSAYQCLLAGIPLRHAASIDGPGHLLTSRHRHPPQPMHEVERGLDLVGGLGFVTERRNLVLGVASRDRAAARSRLAAAGLDLDRPVVILHPGCSCPSRTYPWPRYAEVADRLVEHGCQIALTGTRDESELIERLRARMAHPSVSLAGETTLRQLAATIAIGDVVITNNTGPMHVAAAVETPVVALFALTNPPEQWHPWRVPYRLLNVATPCAPCYVRTCPFENACTSRVAPSAVVAAALELLGRRAGDLTPGPPFLSGEDGPHPRPLSQYWERGDGVRTSPPGPLSDAERGDDAGTVGAGPRAWPPSPRRARLRNGGSVSGTAGEVGPPLGSWANRSRGAGT